MADAAVSAVVELLFTVVKDQIQNDIQLVRGVDKELLNLSDKLKTIKNVLEDADTRRFKEKTVEDWLQRLEQTSYEMEDVLEEWNYALIKHKIKSQSQSQKVCSFLPSSCFCFKELGVCHDIAKKVQDLKSRLDKILKEKDRYNFTISQPKSDPPLASSWRVQSDSSIDLEEVRGRKNDKDILVNKLTANGGSHEELGAYQILSIVGAGGLGKTTLAKLVYNDSRVKACFDLTIWLCVPDPFDVVAIAKGIIEKITKSAPTTNHVLLEFLKDTISGKKILLVLDDVWNEQEEKWKPLKNALKCGGASSTILLTTRKMVVAKIMGTLDEDVHRPDLLSDEECWLLLRRSALSGKAERDHEYFEEAGKEIAKKCNGLPLAAKTLGSVLRSKSTIEEWENVQKSEIWKLKQMKVELFPHLLLSYQELSPALKHCFTYCAFFPKDKKINVDKLIRLWMAMGYLGSSIGTAGDEMELKGRDYFEDLAMRSLFQDFERGLDGRIESCKMHDIVHDFAQFLRNNSREVVIPEMIDRRSCKVCEPILVSRVKEYRSLFWDKETPPNNCECLARLRVLRFEKKLIGGLERTETMIHLQWLDIRGIKLSKEVLKSICKLYFLQTLVLGRCFIEEIPSEIGNLVKMRYLDLSYSVELKELLDGICSLLQLQTLDVDGCMSLSRFPKGIYRLESLKHLILGDNPLTRCFPQELGEFTRLRTLSQFHGGSRWSKLGLLKKLNSLTGSLRLKIKVSGGHLEELVGDAVEAELKNKIHLRRISIEFEDESADEEEPSSSSSSLWVDIIDALEPYHKVQEIKLWNYKGCRLPHWISSPLNHVRDIDLSKCPWVSSLPSLGKLPFLESLNMYELGVKVVGAEWLGLIRESSTAQQQHIPSSSSSSTIVAFPKLTQLSFNDATPLPSLGKLPFLEFLRMDGEGVLKVVRAEFLGIRESSTTAQQQHNPSSSSSSTNTALVAFPKLTHLTFRGLWSWEEWEDITAEEEESEAIQIMPSLVELTIYDCPKLKKLPHRLLRKAQSLQRLKISYSEELKKYYEEEDDNSALRSISLNNTQLSVKIE